MGLTVSEEVFKRFGKVYAPGDALCIEGKVGEEMFIIQSGEVRIHKRVRDRETTLAILKAGDFFGEMAIIDNEPRSASATAVNECKIIILSRDIFESQIKTNPKIIMSILRKMSERLRNADRQIKALLMRDNNSRVTGTLLLLMSKYGKPGENGIVMEPGITRKELVSMTGLPVEKVDEVMQTLANARIVTISADQLIVSSADNLEKFMNYLEMKEQFGI
ncbi:MAG: Crp/Fnr family transcriptional regulator [bacterium]|nr:Crp/Fnr family transcriptional regulator [bacterium]